MTVTDVRFYYGRDKDKRPVVTLCALRADDGRIGYGWAICTDNPDKAIGKRLAQGRAEVALRGGKRSSLTNMEHCYVFNRPISRYEAILVAVRCGSAALSLANAGNINALPPSLHPASFVKHREKELA